MTRDEAEEAARLDAENGEHRTVSGLAETWYEAEWQETRDRILAERRAEMNRRGIVMPWWELS